MSAIHSGTGVSCTGELFHKTDPELEHAGRLGLLDEIPPGNNGVRGTALLSRSNPLQGVRGSGVLSRSNAPGVSLTGTLHHSPRDGGLHIEGTLGKTDALAQVRLREVGPEARITLKESAPKATFFQWVEDKDGNLYLVTMNDSDGKSIGWDRNNETVVQTVDRCAKALLHSTKGVKDDSDKARFTAAQSLVYSLDEDGFHTVEADMPRRDSRSFIRKLGGGAYEAILGPKFGKVKVGLEYGGTFALSREAAKQSHRPIAELQTLFKTQLRFFSEISDEVRRNRAALLKRHAEQLARPNTPVDTQTKIESLDGMIEEQKAEDRVLRHPAVEIVNGKPSQLDLSLFSKGKDVIVPVTVTHSDGTRHAVSIYYEHSPNFSSPQLYFYDSLGKSIEDGGADSLVKLIQDMRPIDGMNKVNPARLVYRPITIHDAKASEHQTDESKDCVRYSLLFFEWMVRRRMKDANGSLKDAFDAFTTRKLRPADVQKTMGDFAQHIGDRLIREKRWHPDDEATFDIDKPVPARGIRHEL